jgi:tripartite-type tricarboxylate transporter receptor subunit TctC
VNKALADPLVTERLKQLGIEKADDSTPASIQAFIKAEIKKWREVVKRAARMPAEA